MKSLLLPVLVLFMTMQCLAQDLEFNVKKNRTGATELISDTNMFFAASSTSSVSGSAWGRTYEWYHINKSRPDTTSIVIAFDALPLQDTIHLSKMPIISGDVLGINRPKMASSIYSWDITIKGPDGNTSTTPNESQISGADATILEQIRSSRKGRATISNLIEYKDTTRIKLNKTLLILP